MIDIQKIAREAGYGDAMSSLHLPALERFATLIREALVQELMAGSRGPCDYQYVFEYFQKEPFYTADQLAGAVLRERERCARICETSWQLGIGGQYQGDVFAAAIRSET